MALSGTSDGVGNTNARATEFAKAIALGTTADRSFVLSAITNAGKPNVSGVVSVGPAMTGLNSGKWGNGWGAHACGYLRVPNVSVVRSTFGTEAGVGYSMNLVSAEFLVEGAEVVKEVNKIYDMDGDGLSDQMEVVFGLNPEDGNEAEPILSRLADPGGIFRYQRMDDALTGYEFRVFISSDLKTWRRDFWAKESVSRRAGSKVEVVTVTLSPTLLTGERQFVRVEAVQKSR